MFSLILFWFGNFLIFATLFFPEWLPENSILPRIIFAVTTGIQLAYVGWMFPRQIEPPLFFIVQRSCFIIVFTLISLSLIRREEVSLLFVSRELTLEEHFSEI